MSLKTVILVVLGLFAFVQAQEGKSDNGSLDSLIDGALSRDANAGGDEIPKVILSINNSSN